MDIFFARCSSSHSPTLTWQVSEHQYEQQVHAVKLSQLPDHRPARGLVHWWLWVTHLVEGRSGHLLRCHVVIHDSFARQSFGVDYPWTLLFGALEWRADSSELQVPGVCFSIGVSIFSFFWGGKGVGCTLERYRKRRCHMMVPWMVFALSST